MVWSTAKYYSTPMFYQDDYRAWGYMIYRCIDEEAARPVVNMETLTLLNRNNVLMQGYYCEFASRKEAQRDSDAKIAAKNERIGKPRNFFGDWDGESRVTPKAQAQQQQELAAEKSAVEQVAAESDMIMVKADDVEALAALEVERVEWTIKAQDDDARFDMDKMVYEWRRHGVPIRVFERGEWLLVPRSA